jgi:hypothetical protein
MGTIGYSYGSEWQLLRLLAYHRDDFNRYVERAIPGSRVLNWLPLRYEADPTRIDTPPLTPVLHKKTGGYVRRPRILDAELKGIEFLPADISSRVQQPWADYWPQRGNQPNWDAVGEIEVGQEVYWLLVEAKSHVKEIVSRCGASEKGGRSKILDAFRATADHMGSKVDVTHWPEPHYQYANRLAVLSFLVRLPIKAKLLFIYFLGDKFPENRSEICPTTSHEWTPHLEAMERQIGWTMDNPLAEHVHKLFLPVCPPPSEAVLRRREPR